MVIGHILKIVGSLFFHLGPLSITVSQQGPEGGGGGYLRVLSSWSADGTTKYFMSKPHSKIQFLRSLPEIDLTATGKMSHFLEEPLSGHPSPGLNESLRGAPLDWWSGPFLRNYPPWSGCRCARVLGKPAPRRNPAWPGEGYLLAKRRDGSGRQAKRDSGGVRGSPETSRISSPICVGNFWKKVQDRKCMVLFSYHFVWLPRSSGSHPLFCVGNVSSFATFSFWFRSGFVMGTFLSRLVQEYAF